MAARTLGTLVGTLALVGLAACGSEDSGSGGAGDSGAAPKIGVFLPLTGENAENGQQINDAIELKVEQVNEAGGVDGEPIELVVRDDRGEPRTATNIAREFAEDDDIIAVLGSFTSTASMAAAPILDTAGIPHLSPTSSHPDFTTMGDAIFRGTPTQDLEASSIAAHLFEDLGHSSTAVIYRQDDWGNSAAEAFAQGAETSGGEVVASEAVAPESRDFRTLISSLRGTDADSLYLALHYSDAAVLAEQLAASGWDPTVITATSLYTAELINLGQDAVNDWIVPAFFYAESEDEHVQEFVAAFEEANDEKPDAFGAVGYDTMSVVVEALGSVEEFGSEGRESLGQAIYEVQVDGVTGTMQFDEQGDVEKTITWLAIEDGQFVPAE